MGIQRGIITDVSREVFGSTPYFNIEYTPNGGGETAEVVIPENETELSEVILAGKDRRIVINSDHGAVINRVTIANVTVLSRTPKPLEMY